jgi:putative chitinase
MFIAQTAHESADYTALQENLNYRAESLLRVWPSHFSADTVEEYAHNPEKIANCAYANRMGNGDEESGDGWRYHGRGLIQLTGKTNYEHFAASIGKSLEEAVEYCATPDGAVESACYFWKAHDLNAKSDDGDIEHVTRAINGGTLGLEDRTNRYNQALDLFQS